MLYLISNKIFPFVNRLDSQSRYNFKIDIISAIGFAFFAGSFYPFYAVIAVRLGVKGLLLALVTAAPYMGQLFAIYWGHKSDQGQKLPFVVISGVLSRLMLILIALTKNIEVFVFLIILHFLLASIGSPAYTSLMKKIYPMQFRGRIMGKIQFIIGLTRIIITYFAGIWLDAHGHRWLFVSAGIFGILSSLYYGKIKEKKDRILPKKEIFSFKEFVKLFKADKMLRLVILGFFIFDLGNLILAPIYPLIQVNYFSLTNFEIGRLSIFWIGGWFLTSPIWGKIVDEYSPTKTIFFSIILFFVSPLIYFLKLPYYFLMLASFFNGAAASSLEVGWINLMLKLGGDNSSKYSGIYLTILGIRGIVGPAIGNLLLKYINPYYIFLLTMFLLLIGIIPFLKFKKHEKKNKIFIDC